LLSAISTPTWLSRGARLRTAAARDLLAIGALALVLRAAWALVYGRVDFGPHDALFYESAASNLANDIGFHQLLGGPSAHWPPGFPFVVSIAYRIFGIHLKLGLALNVVLGAATAVLMYLVAREALGRAAGRVAGFSFAILPAPIFFTGLFLSETMYIFMLVGFLALAVFLPDRRWTPIALGVAAGLAALTKGEGALLPVIPLAMWWTGTVRGAWLRRAAVLVAAMALTIAPWTIRNAIQMDAFIPVATNASTTLWSGHNPEANGGATYAPPELLDRIPKGITPSEREVEEARLLRREAVSWAVHNPLKELGLIPRKLIALGNGASNVFPIWFNAPPPEAGQLGTSSVMIFSVLGDAGDYFLILLALAAVVVIGGRRLWRLDRVTRGALAYLVASLVTYGFVYYGQFRYRLAMEPLMILVATPLLVSVWQQRSALRRPPRPEARLARD
jgi:4-amino-4-deoxy-L-arabinose transferase-like glycosyltransferase